MARDVDIRAIRADPIPNGSGGSVAFLQTPCLAAELMQPIPPGFWASAPVAGFRSKIARAFDSSLAT
jgi:hypothetical protein